MGGQPAPLVVIQEQAPLAEKLAENSILLLDIVDDDTLFPIHPTCQSDEDDLPWTEEHAGHSIRDGRPG